MNVFRKKSRRDDIVVYEDICKYWKDEIQRSVMNRTVLSDEIHKLEKSVSDCTHKHARNTIGRACFQHMYRMYKKENRNLKNEIQVLKNQIDHRDETMSQLIHANENISRQLNTVREAFKTHKENKTATCSICCNENASWNCTNQHVFCTQCAKRECARRLDEMQPSIGCFCVSECNGVIPIDHLCLQTKLPSILKLREEVALNSCRDFMRNFLLSWTDKGKMQDQLFLRLSLACADGTYNAFQCPRCEYGPILHTDCSNLRTHHFQQSKKGRIDNRCPKCHTLYNDVYEMKRWNGKF